MVMVSREKQTNKQKQRRKETSGCGAEVRLEGKSREAAKEGKRPCEAPPRRSWSAEIRPQKDKDVLVTVE